MEVPIFENRERLRTQVTQMAPSQVGPRAQEDWWGCIRGFHGVPKPERSNKRTWGQRGGIRQEHLPV